jgi:hypothetical protein
VERTRLVVDTTDVETLVASEEGCAESATGMLFWLTSSQFQKDEPFPLTVTWGREARFSTAGVAAAEAARTLVTATRETDFMVVAGVFVCVVDGNSSRSVGARVGVGVVVSAREVLNESRRRGARCVEKGIRRRKEEVAVERTRARKTVWAVGGTAERMGYIWGRRGQAQAGTTVQAGMLGGRDWLRGRARAGAVAANFAQPLTSSTKAAPSSDKEVKDGATSHQAWPRKTGALLIVLI